MGFTFEAGTTMRGHPIEDVIGLMAAARTFEAKAGTPLATDCVDMGFLRGDPCDPEALMLTDLGNIVRAGRIGDRIPHRDALERLNLFMEEVCAAWALRCPPDGIIDRGWIFGSMMRGDPTIGDIDISIEMPQKRDDDGFISVSDSSNIELRSMPIPCQQIVIRCDGGEVRWEILGSPDLHPECFSLDDPPDIQAIKTDQGIFRTGMADQETVDELVRDLGETIRRGDEPPETHIATLGRDLRSRYTGGRHADEPAAALLELTGPELRNALAGSGSSPEMEPVF